MHRDPVLKSVVFVGVLSAAVASGACQREEPGTNVPELRAEDVYPTDRPMTVSGCLIAGEAENTFVLTAARADDQAETATYQLVALPNIELRDEMRDHVGELVRVDGTLRARETATAQSVAVPADTENDRPTGTAGEPMVQTRTNVKINQLTVDSMTPLGEECGIGM